MAERSSDPANRDGFLRLAREWKSLAREAERAFGVPSPCRSDPESSREP